VIPITAHDNRIPVDGNGCAEFKKGAVRGRELSNLSHIAPTAWWLLEEINSTPLVASQPYTTVFPLIAAEFPNQSSLTPSDSDSFANCIHGTLRPFCASTAKSLP